MAHGGSGLGIEGRVVSLGRCPDLCPVPRWLPIPFKPALLWGLFFDALQGRKLGLVGGGAGRNHKKTVHGDDPEHYCGYLSSAGLIWLTRRSVSAKN